MALSDTQLQKLREYYGFDKPLLERYVTWTEADRAARAFEVNPAVFCQYNDDNVFDPKYRVLHDLLEQGLAIATGKRKTRAS